MNRWTTILAVLAVGGCEQVATEPIETGQVRFAVVSGSGQIGEAGQELPDPLVVSAVATNGRPLRGQLVNFVVTEGGGSVFAGAALTDRSGLAYEWWTLGEAGPQTVEVRATDPSQAGAKLVFGTFTASLGLRWQSLAGIPTPVSAPTAAAVGTRIYVLGGGATYYGGPETFNQIFDVTTGQWSSGAAIPIPVGYASAVSLDQRVHLIGGAPIAHYMYDPPTDSWSEAAAPPVGGLASAAEVVDGRLFLIGGGGAVVPKATVQVYDPVSDSWSLGSPMPTGRQEMASAVVNGLIYVAGGTEANIVTSSALEVKLTRFGGQVRT